MSCPGAWVLLVSSNKTNLSCSVLPCRRAACRRRIFRRLAAPPSLPSPTRRIPSAAGPAVTVPIAAAAARPAVAVPIAAQPAVAVSAAVQPSVAETCRRPALPAGNLPPSSPTCPIVYLRLGTRFDLAPHPGSDFVRVVSGSTRLFSDRLV